MFYANVKTEQGKNTGSQIRHIIVCIERTQSKMRLLEISYQ